MKFIRKQFNYSYNNCVIFLIAANVIIFLLTRMNPKLYFYLGLNPQAVDKAGALWQFVTYMFVHDLFSFQHIIFNMLGLFIFGPPVERKIGSKEFLLFYFVCGIGAGVFSYFFFKTTGQTMALLVGASGAIYALLLAYAVIYPDSYLSIMGIFPLRAPYVVILYTAIEIFSQLSSVRSNVAHLTHLAGFAFAYFYFIIRFGINPAGILFRRR